MAEAKGNAWSRPKVKTNSWAYMLALKGLDLEES